MINKPLILYGRFAEQTRSSEFCVQIGGHLACSVLLILFPQEKKLRGEELHIEFWAMESQQGEEVSQNKENIDEFRKFCRGSLFLIFWRFSASICS